MRLTVVLATLAGLIFLAAPLRAPGASDDPADAGLIVVVAANDIVHATGAVPPDFPMKSLRKRIPEITLGEVTASSRSGEPGGSDAQEWERVLDALTIAIPRLREGSVRIAGKSIGITGTLKPGFNLQGTRGALRLALGSAWEMKMEITEAPPPAAIAVEKSADGFAVSGILPAGIDPADAMALLGDPSSGGLTGGGDGDVAVWGTALARLGKLAGAYADLNGAVSDGVIEVDGQLLPGYDAGRLAEWFRGRLPDDWRVSLSGRELPATEGDLRQDFANGRTERLRRGHWVPEFGFAPEPSNCAASLESVQASRQITFVAGKTQVDAATMPLLDQVAGIAIRCLNDGGLRLEIGGHTDSRGDPADNLALSRARAMVVLLELMERGVRTDAMTAVGYGEQHPIADNGTAEGRAANRRITFDWSG